MSAARARIEAWVGRGAAAGALIGLLEGAERTWAVREFLRDGPEAARFAALAFGFCLLSGIALGFAAGAVAIGLEVVRRPLRSPGLGRAVAGAAVGAAAAAWGVFALTLTVRFDRLLGNAPMLVAAGAGAGAFTGLVGPALGVVWRWGRSGPRAAVTGAALAAFLVAVHLWNAHFAPQSSLGVHALADTLLATIAFGLASLIPGAPRGRVLIAWLVVSAGAAVWIDATMRHDAVVENLLKTRGSIGAHAIRMWSAAMDFDGDGHAPPFLVGGEDHAIFDSGSPLPVLRPPAPGPATAVFAPGARDDPGAAPRASRPRPNIVLLTLDACRFDVVPPATPSTSRLADLQPPLPRLEALSGRVARFAAGYTPSAGTEDTFAALFSGWDLPGILAGVPRDRYLATRLAEAGYAVRGYVNEPGFFVSSFESAWLERWGAGDGRRMIRAASSFLDSLPEGRPGFCWIHLMDLHADLLRPFARETFSHRAHLLHYAAALARVDSLVGDFVAALDSAGLTPRTLLVVTADHGEELGGHGHYHHNLSLYHPAIRVPLWIAGPGVVPGERPARISIHGLYATLLEAAGIEPGGAAQGSLWPVLSGARPAASDSEIYSFLPQRGFSRLHGRFHHPELGQATLIDAARRRKVILRLGLESWEAYDIAADSLERWNIAGRERWPDSLRVRLEHMIEARGAPPATATGSGRDSARPRRRRRAGRTRSTRRGAEAKSRHLRRSGAGPGARPAGPQSIPHGGFGAPAGDAAPPAPDRHRTCGIPAIMVPTPDILRPAAPRSGRRRRALALALGLLLAPVAPGADSLETEEPDTTNIAGSVTLPSSGEREVLPAVSRPFQAGERLRFSVQYGPIKAGSAYLEVPEVGEWEGRPTFVLLARAESNAFFSRFYKVRNRIESRWDADGRFSRRYTENRLEGKHRVESEIVFDPERGEARYQDGQTYPIPPQVQDALSSFYYTRMQALPLGGSVVFDYHASRKSQPLEVKVLGRERVKTPAGTFETVAIEPLLKAGGIFKNKGRLVIWLTDDERRMPVMMRSKVAIGSISVILQDARPGG